MNENDGRDREVGEYVRNRMAADMPPDFTGNVMNDVHRTTQRRRGFAWPVLTGLATVAAAAAAVIIGLNLIGPGDVGSNPTPTPISSPSATPGTSPTEEPSASPTATPSASPSAEPTTGEGEFGPIHSMTTEDAFANAQTCENPGVINTVGEQTDVTYRIAFPEGWFTNAGTDSWAACSQFAPEAIEERDDGSVPENVAVVVNMPPGGDFGPGGEWTVEEYTVDGLPAFRYDIQPTEGGFTAAPTIVWIIALSGEPPAEGNDQPYLAISTSSEDPAEFAEWVDILDRMVATLDILEP